MKKALYLVGSMEATIGILLICFDVFIYGLKDSYYDPSFLFVFILAIVLIAVGIVQSLFAFMKNPKEQIPVDRTAR